MKFEEVRTSKSMTKLEAKGIIKEINIKLKDDTGRPNIYYVELRGIKSFLLRRFGMTMKEIGD